MSLLTLIILGEGIIVVVKSIGKIVKQENAYSSATVGNIIAAVAMIYFLYMLYFDWLNIHNHFGSIRQQIWTFLHFPFHLFLVLSLEGTSQVIIVRKLAEAITLLSDKFLSAFEKFNDDSVEYSMDDLISTFNSTIQGIFKTYPPTYTQTITEVQEGLEQLRDATANSTRDDAVTDVLATVVNSIYETYGIELREEDVEKMTSAEQNEKYAHVFRVLVRAGVPPSPSHSRRPSLTNPLVCLLLRHNRRHNPPHEPPKLPIHFPQILRASLPRFLATPLLQHRHRPRPLRHCRHRQNQ